MEGTKKSDNGDRVGLFSSSWDDNRAERQTEAAERPCEITVFWGLSRQTVAAVNPTAAAGHAALLREALLSVCVCVCERRGEIKKAFMWLC